MDCRDMDRALAAYVDGECAAIERETVEAHLRACPRCRCRAASERTTHELLRARCQGLRVSAPAELRQRCAAQRVLAGRPHALRRAWIPASIAAAVLIGVGGLAFVGWGSSSVEAYAAQIAIDHIKCFQFAPDAARGDVDTLARDWLAASGWALRVAEPSAPDQLELLGIRRCGSTKGRLAHILYRWRGAPLSVYVLNARADVADARHDLSAHDHDALRKLGEQEIIWSDHGRTYAVVARARLEDLQQVARYVRRRIE